jgi:hypothetical protein
VTQTLTILACPKPFTGHTAVIQRNAIKSWTLLEPRPQILLFGDENGTGAVCAELDLRHVPDVARHEGGTPLLNAMVETAQATTAGRLFCFINSDIVLMQDFAEAVDQVARRKRVFLLIGQRRDLDVTEPLSFADGRWQEALRDGVKERGRLHGPFGIDYFVFTAGLFDPIPPLMIGRAAVDNWMVYRARSRWAPVIDATDVVTAVHQNHDYSHLPAGREGVFEGADAQVNWRLAGGPEYRFWISDRTHTLTRRGLRADLSGAQLRRHWDRLPVIVPQPLRPPARLFHAMGRSGGAVLRALGLRRALP